MFTFEREFSRPQRDGWFLERLNRLLNEEETLEFLSSQARSLRASNTFDGSAVNAAQALCCYRGIKVTVNPSNLLGVIEQLLT